MTSIPDYVDLDEFDRQKALYGPFTDTVRELVDATIRTEVDDEVIREVQATIAAATAKLRARQLDGAFGRRFTPTGQSVMWGNAGVGLRNAIAPPLVFESDESGRHWTDVNLGAAYEGPPGLVHGGVCALVLDHLLGVTASKGTRRFTGTLTLRYLRGTPLGPVHATATIVGVDGRKATVRGTLSDPDGVTVEAEGIFISPAAPN
ncbi:PaaI family thioesterase [Rhodococcus tukisamuensis]|uniref:Thioesterase superfamily protein n=1 Tax=Rhodococcus tukisamuensis TaxID=168276 RepID=A0A1G6UYX7_9NOCA|nr:PaaI family thioesterase [Rhodococcus tukisamuensis]SDD45876.1 Thioesterase superfamily protein [Rhodococcus tukisamuensis]